MDEIGKNISGAGMDTKVVNRGVNGEYNPWPGVPTFERVFVRDMNELSYGNAVGIGMADVVHDRLLERIDWEATRVNCSLPPRRPTPASRCISRPTGSAWNAWRPRSASWTWAR